VTCLAAGGGWLYSGGKDRAARVWSEAKGKLTCVAVLAGHGDSVQAVAASPGGALAATGGWDRSVRLWPGGEAAVRAAGAAEAEADGDDDGKSRKRTRGARRAPELREPAAELTGHSQCVAGLSWPVEESLVSASWDHTVRIWDVEERVCREQLTVSKAVYCAAVRDGDARCLTALGGADKAWRLWDPRGKTADGAVVLKAFSSHKGWVSSISWCPTDANLLLTASFDGAVKVWDVRGSVPLHTVNGHSDKVLAALWKDPACALSGGADSKLAALRLPARK